MTTAGEPWLLDVEDVATALLALTGAPPCDELLNVDTSAALTMPAPT
jgi:hypothetical protein